MKNLIIVLLFCGIYSAAFAQKKLLSRPYQPHKSKATVNEYLEELKQYSGTVIEYSSNNIDTGKLIQLQGNETTVGGVLQKVLEGQLLKLLEHNNKIILVPSPEPFTMEHFLPGRYSFFGYLKEEESNEPLINATIYDPASQRGIVSNNQGYFNFLLTEGKHTVEISYGGLQPVTLELNIHGNLRKDVSLSMKKEMPSSIVVASEGIAKDGAINVTGNQHSSNGIMGEADPMQSTCLSPGVQNASASFSGFQVRGGGTDENLFLLDGNTVYNPAHMLGAISIINPTVLKAIRLYRSDFPAKFTGSLSSVLDVYTKEGNMKSWHGEVNVGLRAGSLTLEGPLVKNKTALMVSARKSISLPFYQSLQDGITADFYDAHFRITTILNPRNKLAFNFYKGEDQLRQTGKDIDNLHRWGNVVGSIGWNTVLGSRSFINTSINISHYQDLGGFQYTLFRVDDDDDDNQKVETKFIGIYSFIQNYNAKSQAEIHVSKNLKLNTGLKLAQTIIKPFDSQFTSTLEDDEKDFSLFGPLQFEELSSYFETEIKLRQKLFVKPGVHASVYQFENYRTSALQPRFYISYRFLRPHKVYASYSKMNQFLHLVTSPYPGVNKDLWVPSTEQLQPESSEIYNLGYSFNHKKLWKLSFDAYYKRLINVTNYAEGKSSFINNNNWEQSIESGKGRSYGTEYLLEKNGAKLSWQAGYALSWSWRQFKNINNGKEFPYKYDHRHTANIGFIYSLSPQIDISGLWTLATGNVYTLAGWVFTDTVQQVSADDDPLEDYQFTYHYSEETQYRAKSYQRYDVAINCHSPKGRKLYSLLKAGIYNINGSADQYSYTVRGSLSSKSIFIKTGSSVFKIIPYISYTLRF